MSLDSLLKTGAEAAMMMGANTRNDIYKGIDRTNKQIDLNSVSDILANSDLDFDNPATFAPVMQQLDQITPGLGAKMGQQLYAISNERMKAASAVAKNLSMGKAYLGQAANQNAQAGMHNADARRINFATDTLSQGVNDGSINNLVGARAGLKTPGDLSTPSQITDRTVQKTNIGAAADRYAADQGLAAKNYAADQQRAWENYASDAAAKAKVEAAKLKGGSSPASSPLGKLDSQTVQGIMTTGVPMLQQMFPEITNLTNPDGSISDSAAAATMDAYRVGTQLLKQNPSNAPVTMGGILRLGFDYLKKNGALGTSSTTIPGKHGFFSNEPDVTSSNIVYNPQAGGGQVQAAAPVQAQAPTSAGQPLRPNFMDQPSRGVATTPPGSGSSLESITQPPAVVQQPSAAQTPEDKAKTLQAIIDKTRKLYTDMVERRIPKDNSKGFGDSVTRGMTPDNALERGITSGLHGVFNLPHNIGKALSSLPKGSLVDTLESQAQQSIDPRDTPEQIIIKNITAQLRAAGYNDPTQVKQMVAQILQEVQRKPYNGFQ